jgi:hypothetical protein
VDQENIQDNIYRENDDEDRRGGPHYSYFKHANQKGYWVFEPYPGTANIS